MLKIVLDRAGHEVQEASNGKEVLELYRKRPADLIVTDLVIPDKEVLSMVIFALASLVLAAFLSTETATATSSITGADHVRWDIISLDTSTTPPTLRPGGVAFAKAITGSALSGLQIRSCRHARLRPIRPLW